METVTGNAQTHGNKSSFLFLTQSNQRQIVWRSSHKGDKLDARPNGPKHAQKRVKSVPAALTLFAGTM